ncbi:MAG: PD40 domain-containing protein [Anaerolineales bacterium]|nr:PD40 domain-containing protein [Anaerolineales bacterium]
MRSSLRRLGPVLTLLVFFLIPLAGSHAQPQALITINVVVQRVRAFCDPEGSGQDFYPVVEIGDTLFSFADEVTLNRNHVYWRWVATGQADDAGGAIPLTIYLKELDGDWPFGLDDDDSVDVNPKDNAYGLGVTFFPATGLWTVDQGAAGPPGDPAPGQWRVWRGEEGPDCAEIEFDIVAGSTEDQDDDGLLDNWETQGLDADGDGLLDVDLPGMGALVDHKDLFVEADWMQAADHSHEPLQNLWLPVWRVFHWAPVANPDGVPGIRLHVDTGSLYSALGSADCDNNGAPTTGDIDCDGDGLIDIGDLGALGAGTPGGGNLVTEQQFLSFTHAGDDADFYETKEDNFVTNRAWVFHYAVFAHSLTQATPTTSGVGEVYGNDLIVSLGGWADTVTDTTTSPITGLVVSGTVRAQAGTFLHELGHNLNLDHGASYLVNGQGYNSNYQPNYLSVMNYDYQFGVRGLRSNLRLGMDYTGALTPDLDENSLDDCAVLGPLPVNALVYWTVSTNITNVISAAVTGPAFTVNWNQDVTGLGLPVRQGDSCGNATNDYALDLNARAEDEDNLIVLDGLDDWHGRLNLRFQLSSKYEDGEPSAPHQDITFQTYQAQEAGAPRLIELEAPGQMCSSAEVVDFDGLAVGTLVESQYLGQGVLFPDNPDIELKVRDGVGREADTWSPPNSLYAGPALGGDSIGKPLVISYTTPMRRVGLAMGNGGTLNAVAVLRAYDANGQLIGQVFDVIPEDVTEFLGVLALEELIGYIELDYPIAEPEEIDYLTFDDCPDPDSLTPPPDGPVTLEVDAEARDVAAAEAGQQTAGGEQIVVIPLAAVPVTINGVAEVTDYAGEAVRGDSVTLAAPRWAVGPDGSLYAFAYWRQEGRRHLEAGSLTVARDLNDNAHFTAVYHRSSTVYLPSVAQAGGTLASTSTPTPPRTPTRTPTATPTSTAAPTGTTSRVSLTSGGAQATGASYFPSLADNGQVVAFYSYAANLVPGDSNAQLDVFVRDLGVITTTRVSVASSGAQGNGPSYNPRLSGDGRWVAFESQATNLVLTDTNSLRDVFVHDRQTGVTIRVSVGPAGAQATGQSGFGVGGNGLAISQAGGMVAFQSEAANLVLTDTNSARDIFVHDLGTHLTTRVSVSTGGGQANGVSTGAALSADGRYVAFDSTATNLVAGDTNGAGDIFVHDRQTGVTTRVSIGLSGAQPNSHSRNPVLSADGRYVAYTSAATNLVTGDSNGADDIFIYDRQTGTTTRASVATGGVEANGFSDRAALSADGRYLAFKSTASNLVAGDSNGLWDIFVHDRQTGQTTRVSVGPGGAQANGDSNMPVISALGRYVAYAATATNLVAGDTNAAADVFVRDRGP